MICPYCAEEIKDAAIVCKYCCRDLFVVRPLMEKPAEATKRLEALETGGSREPLAVAAPVPQTTAHSLPSVEPLTAMTLTFLFLVLGHFIIIVEYNLQLIFLRMVSIAVPFAFGFLCREARYRTPLIELGYGLVVAAASILAMSTIVGKIDNVPVLPRDAYEWWEFAEYGVSITFGFYTGAIVRQSVIAMRFPEGPRNRLIARISRVIAGARGGKIGRIELRTVESVVRTVAALASGIVSVVTGLRQFF